MVKTLKKITRSVKTAFRGILRVYGTEISFRIQFWFGVIVLTQTFYWPIGEMKRLILILLVFLMLITEIVNTAFEKLFDEIEKRYHSKIGYLKDILAGAALLMAISSATIGIIILWPYILKVILFALVESGLIIILIYSFRGIRKLVKR
jgi:diacylglycerol kinase (ATP)